MGTTDEKTRPISLRVEVSVLDALARAGLSPTEVARAALEKEARRANALAALKELKERPPKVSFDSDSVTLVRRDRETHA